MTKKLDPDHACQVCAYKCVVTVVRGGSFAYLRVKTNTPDGLGYVGGVKTLRKLAKAILKEVGP